VKEEARKLLKFRKMEVRVVNPLEWPAWDDELLLLENHSIFHSTHWARVLVEAYGYKPVYFAAMENGRLKGVIPLMEVRSVLTGRRGVSLPFTDFCDLLATDGPNLRELNETLIRYGKTTGWRSIEWRGGGELFRNERISKYFYRHTVFLAGEERELQSRLRSSTRRNISKARKEGVEVKVSRSFDAVVAFSRLNCLTRRHHGLPPQPMHFFRKVFEHIISRDQGLVALGLYKDRVISACMYFHFGKNAIYKYGASDRRFLNLRPNNLVMWEALRWYQSRGFSSISLGRSEPENTGLLQFKRGWNAKEDYLPYHRLNLTHNQFVEKRGHANGIATRMMRVAPLPLLRFLGAVLYRHVG
jgi:hypothetical protein